LSAQRTKLDEHERDEVFNLLANPHSVPGRLARGYAQRDGDPADLRGLRPVVEAVRHGLTGSPKEWDLYADDVGRFVAELKQRPEHGGEEGS
jgi:hypothetical protein